VEEFLSHVIHTALWAMLVVFVFAAIGVYATIRWVYLLVTGTERAVEAETNEVKAGIDNILHR
jgi:uncharacterized membrane protein